MARACSSAGFSAQASSITRLLYRLSSARLEGGLGFDLLFGLGRGLGRHGLDVDIQLHLVPDDEPAGFQRLVPRQVEVLAVHLRFGGKPDAPVAPWVLDLTGETGVERDLLGKPVNRQIADDLEVRRVRTFDSRALKRNRR